MPNWTKPYYTVQLTSIACQYELLVNGYPLDDHDEMGNVSAEVPINPYIFTGKNGLQVVLRPDLGAEFQKHATFTAMVCGREDEAPVSQSEPITGFRFSGERWTAGTGLEDSPDFGKPGGPEATRMGEGTIRVDRAVELQTPFPRWTWMDAPLLDDTPDTRASLLGEYRRFHGLLAGGDRAALEALTAVRSHEIALAYYVSDQQGREMVDVGANIGAPEMTLLELNPDLRLETIAGRRCARFLTPGKKSPIVYAFSGEPGMGLAMSLTYCRDQSGRWLQIR